MDCPLATSSRPLASVKLHHAAAYPTKTLFAWCNLLSEHRFKGNNLTDKFSPSKKVQVRVWPKFKVWHSGEPRSAGNGDLLA